MNKLRNSDISMLKYFWQQKEDLESWTEFKEKFPLIKEQFPYLADAWEDYKRSKLLLDIIITSL